MQSFDSNEDWDRFGKLIKAYSDDVITYKQLSKAEDYGFNLEQILYWDSLSFWGKIKLVFGFDRD